MKKIIFLSIILLACNSFSFGQAFKKGAMFIDAGFGLGIQHYQFIDKTNNTTDPRDTSGAIEVPFNFEYGILNWLGASIDGNFASYLTGDSAKNESAKGIDFVPTINLHAPFKLNKLDLGASIGYGYSHFSYKVNDASGGVAKANGSVFNWGIRLRWLFKTDGHLGMNFWYTHSNYMYKKGEITDNFGNKPEFQLDGPGNNFGLGFFFRIAD